MATKSFSVFGMNCQHCVANIKNAVESIEGVSSVKIFQEQQFLKIEADPMPPLETLNKVLSENGHYQLTEL